MFDQQKKLAAFLRSTQHPDRKVAGKLVSDYLEDMNGKLEHENMPEWYPTGKTILQSTPELKAHVLLQILQVGSPRLFTMRGRLLNESLVFNEDQMIELLASWGGNPGFGVIGSAELAPQLRRYRESIPHLPEIVADYLQYTRPQMIAGWHGKQSDSKHLQLAIEDVLGETANGRLPDTTGEGWVTQTIADVSEMSEEEQRDWKRFLHFLDSVDGGKPAKDWQKRAQGFIASLGIRFAPTVARWLASVTTPEVTSEHHTETYGNGNTYAYVTHRPHHTDRNISILKGLAWCCAGRTEPEIARALEKMTVGCLAKVPGTGPWAVRAASAAVYALAESPDNPEAVPALARLKSKVTFRTTLTQIEKALETAAKRQGVTKDDLEDLSVPTYGLDSDGVGRKLFATVNYEKGTDGD
ncbi:MAG: hypothetical protein H7145_21015 [Akkermansiaceae bacterium]|nr:hypothetical protein [Armatimonadota bacterium]